MPKINKGYQSIIDFMLAHDYPWVERVAEYFSLTELPVELRYNPYQQSQLLGALQPLADMVQAAKNSFKPYKSKANLYSDLLMVVRGIANVGKGLLTMVAAVGIFLIETVRAIATGSFKAMLNNLYNTASWLVNGVASIIRGMTQIVAAVCLPLLAARVAIRAALSGNGYQKFEDNEGIRFLVNTGRFLAKEKQKPEYLSDSELQKEICADQLAIVRELRVKYVKASKNGQEIDPNVTPAIEEKAFSNAMQDFPAISDYLTLFGKNQRNKALVLGLPLPPPTQQPSL